MRVQKHPQANKFNSAFLNGNILYVRRRRRRNMKTGSYIIFDVGKFDTKFRIEKLKIKNIKNLHVTESCINPLENNRRGGRGKKSLIKDTI